MFSIVLRLVSLTSLSLQIVANRMLNRMIVFFGAPVFGGLTIFVGAFFYSKKYDIVIPPSIIAYATQAPFVLGLLGITYSILSSSWDPEVCCVYPK